MTVRELLAAVSEHAEDGTRTGDEVVVLVGRERRSLATGYSDGTFVLVAGAPVVGG